MILLDTINGKQTSRPPVWFMRQAGRVLPNYNTLKEKYSFRELMHDPKLASKVTLMPVDDLCVDAAILFSDILVIPEAMGMEVSFTDNGPRFNDPLKNFEKPSSYLRPEPYKLDYIFEVMDEINRNKPVDIPLIGFCGAPLTTLCYMIQGISANTNFPDAVKFLYARKKEAVKLIDSITDLSIYYVLKQIEHGASVFQLFDTHAGLIPISLYKELFLPAILKIAQTIRDTGTPFIFFPKGLGTGLELITPDMADIAGIDWQIPLEYARTIIHPEIGLQGNLDPRLLFAPRSEIEKELEKYTEFYRNNKKWIFNLGHGFLPDTPFENAKFIVEWIKNKRWE